MFDELVKKSKEQDIFNNTLTKRMDSLVTTSHGRGKRPAPHATDRVTPTMLNFSTPMEAPRVRRVNLNVDPTPGSHGRDVNKHAATDSKSALPDGSGPAGGSTSVVDLEDDAEEDSPDEPRKPRQEAARQDQTARKETYYEDDERYAEELAFEEERFLQERQRAAERRRAAPRSQQAELDELRASMNRTALDLKEMRSQMHRATSKAPEIDRVLEEAQRTPFTARISRARLSDPGKIKMPTYEGKSDPTDHITAFTIAMGRANFREDERDIGQCHLFVEHLKGPALQWFSGLESNSIDNFGQLSAAFLKHYAIFMERRTLGADLWKLTQGPAETLRSFIERFKDILSRVKGIND